jgi:hypothetical protein
LTAPDQQFRQLNGSIHQDVMTGFVFGKSIGPPSRISRRVCEMLVERCVREPWRAEAELLSERSRASVGFSAWVAVLVEEHVDFLETEIDLHDGIGAVQYSLLNAAPADQAEFTRLAVMAALSTSGKRLRSVPGAGKLLPSSAAAPRALTGPSRLCERTRDAPGPNLPEFRTDGSPGTTSFAIP